MQPSVFFGQMQKCTICRKFRLIRKFFSAMAAFYETKSQKVFCVFVHALASQSQNAVNRFTTFFAIITFFFVYTVLTVFVVIFGTLLTFKTPNLFFGSFCVTFRTCCLVFKNTAFFTLMEKFTVITMTIGFKLAVTYRTRKILIPFITLKLSMF